MCPSTSARNGSGARQPQGEPRAAFGRFRHQNVAAHRAGERAGNVEPQPAAFRILAEPLELGENPLPVGFGHAAALIVDRYSRLAFPHLQSQRSEQRRVGQECVSTFRSRWSPYYKQKKKKQQQQTTTP